MKSKQLWNQLLSAMLLAVMLAPSLVSCQMQPEASQGNGDDMNITQDTSTAQKNPTDTEEEDVMTLPYLSFSREKSSPMPQPRA